MKITAKDFFLHVGAIASFYASIIALITLLFSVINYAYPRITDSYYYYSPSISLNVATLIVAFPLFLLLSRLLQKAYASEPTLQEVSIRRWLSYITLFIAGGAIAVDLITVIYMFLDGQDLTKGFLLKVLTLLIIASGVFIYYLRNIRNMISPGERNVWRIVSILFILISIGVGFKVIGTPAEQRAARYDNQRVMDLQNIQWQVLNYWQQKGKLPVSLADLNDSLRGNNLSSDPVTHAQYEYTISGPLSFNLCATFSSETRLGRAPMNGSRSMPVDGLIFGKEGENWEHPAGRHCYMRTIDPDLYPPTKR